MKAPGPTTPEKPPRQSPTLLSADFHAASLPLGLRRVADQGASAEGVAEPLRGLGQDPWAPLRAGRRLAPRTAAGSLWSGGRILPHPRAGPISLSHGIAITSTSYARETGVGVS